jgi:hypothetical protein
MSSAPFSACLARDEAILRFPYDDSLRMLLRAIPGRRWDPLKRAWCLPLAPDQSEALARLFESLPGEPDIERTLHRAIERRRRRRSREECLIDLVRADENWWLSFATDGDPNLVKALLEHPGARELPVIGRALVPLDDRSAELVERVREADACLRLTEAVRSALLAPMRLVRMSVMTSPSAATVAASTGSSWRPSGRRSRGCSRDSSG